MESFEQFPFEQFGEYAAQQLRDVYQRHSFQPTQLTDVLPLPAVGEGQDGLRDVLNQIVAGSAGLAAGNSLGHMDTAPHPAAAFCDALVSAVNNNLLFREISPIASRVEESLVEDIGHRLGLSDNWHGTFVSGGSLANLTALFAATGGLKGVDDRSMCQFFLPPCVHLSVKKSLAVLGVSEKQIVVVSGDFQGRARVAAWQ